MYNSAFSRRFGSYRAEISRRPRLLCVNEYRYYKVFPWFIDGMVLTVTTGRDGTAKRVQLSTVVPSRRQYHTLLIHTCLVPFRPFHMTLLYCGPLMRYNMHTRYDELY